MKLKIMLLAVVCGLLSGCAGISAHLPKATLDTNIPFFYRSGITVYNSSSPDIVVIPQSRGDGFVSEYQYGERDPWCLWLCRKKVSATIISVGFGQSAHLPLLMNLNQNTVYTPFSLKVLRKMKNGWRVIGFWNQCFAVPPSQDIYFDLNFSKRELEAMSRGYNGQQCSGYGGWY